MLKILYVTSFTFYLEDCRWFGQFQEIMFVGKEKLKQHAKCKSTCQTEKQASEILMNMMMEYVKTLQEDHRKGQDIKFGIDGSDT